jgi:hypothetical protein
MGRRATMQCPQLLPGRARLQGEEEFLLVVFAVVVEDAMKHQAAVVAESFTFISLCIGYCTTYNFIHHIVVSSADSLHIEMIVREDDGEDKQKYPSLHLKPR